MSPDEERVLEGVIAAFRAYLHEFTRHAQNRAQARAISLRDAGDGIRGDAPEIIEVRPQDPRGPSCLILCQGPSGIMYHVLCSYPPAVDVITVYEPNRDRWTADLRRRLR